ncbi:MAG: ethanolamine permease [Actinomycetota bacterium]|nr:ethanolamine permease [Actinomycetota bacterium]
MAKKERRGAVEYEHVGTEYMEDRKLERHAGKLLIWGLGVGYVISGEYFSWNFGLDAGGFGGMLIATLLMIGLYVLMIYNISEMATAFPHTGGPYAFARRTMGPWGGFAIGIAAILEYVLATAAIAITIGAYITALPCCDSLPSILGLTPVAWLGILAYLIFVGINIAGVQQTLSSVLVITVIAVAMLIVWALVMLFSGDFSTSNFTNIQPEGGNSDLFPFGFIKGTLAALPFAAWFYLAIEGVPMASEETRDPARDLPQGTILAMWTLVALSAIAFFVGVGVGSAEGIRTSLNPIPNVVSIAQGENFFFWLVTIVGLCGLLASFFSIIFAYSRIIFSLSRAGYFPRALSVTGTRRTPYIALIVPAVLACILIVLYNESADAVANIVQMSVFGALVTYVLMMVAFILFRRNEPNAERPYRSPVGVPGAVVVIAIAVLAMFSSLAYDVPGAKFGVAATIIAIVAGLIYFGAYSRHRLVAEAPEEEFAVMERAEAELDAAETAAAEERRRETTT